MEWREFHCGWEPHAVVRVPGKSRSEESGTRADTASSDAGPLVGGCPFLPLKDSRASDFCVQPPKVFARWERLPAPFIVMDGRIHGLLSARRRKQQGRVKNKGVRRHSEGSGEGSGVGVPQVRDHQTDRQEEEDGEGRRQLRKAVSSTALRAHVMWQRLREKYDEANEHKGWQETIAFEGWSYDGSIWGGGQEKADWSPTCTRVAEMVNSNDQIGCT